MPVYGSFTVLASTEDDPEGNETHDVVETGRVVNTVGGVVTVGVASDSSAAAVVRGRSPVSRALGNS